MKQFLLTSILILFSNPFFAQIEFETGFFINNRGQKTEAFIQNNEWLNNPVQFRYKLTKNSSSQIFIGELNEVSEFKVGGQHFVRSEVQVDQSKDTGGRYSTKPEPEFEKEVLFLNTLVKGDASLFKYKRGRLVRYFYQHGNGKIEPLVYKHYLRSGGLASNNKYRQQLLENFKCGKLNHAELKRIEYKTEDLVDFFTNYNSCVNSEFISYYNITKRKGIFHITLKPGLSLGVLEVENGFLASGINLEEMEPRIGVEFQYILPFNQNRWGVFIEPTYHKFVSEEEIIKDFSTALLKVDYSSLELYSGLRHYFFLSDKHKIFLNGGIIVDFPLDSQIIFLETNRVMDPELTDLDLSVSPAFGLGTEIFDKISFELRYTKRGVSGRKIVQTHYDLDWRSNYSSFSFVLGYTFL
ncbi:porin family protein [Salegentibacter sediminis]|uniref:outer membrane beta-barrel protein n=1 Tax=Salegentibacter sediminis TaxID=1930251 RepID=UPI0009BFCEA1|nr:outer membrane beta-barrel protein [Salegentibacter sediminis]